MTYQDMHMFLKQPRVRRQRVKFVREWAVEFRQIGSAIAGIRELKTNALLRV